MILITTSRRPSRRTRRFCRELSAVLPHSFYVNRGKASLRTVVERAFVDGYSRVLIVGETKGNPSLMRFLDVQRSGWRWLYQFYIDDVHLLLDEHRKYRELDADGLLVRAELAPLREVFDVYPECTSDCVELIEQGGNVRFTYNGKAVGPRFHIKGVDRVPDNQQLQP